MQAPALACPPTGYHTSPYLTAKPDMIFFPLQHQNNPMMFCMVDFSLSTSISNDEFPSQASDNTTNLLPISPVSVEGSSTSDSWGMDSLYLMKLNIISCITEEKNIISCIYNPFQRQRSVDEPWPRVTARHPLHYRGGQGSNSCGYGSPISLKMNNCWTAVH